MRRTKRTEIEIERDMQAAEAYAKADQANRNGEARPVRVIESDAGDKLTRAVTRCLVLGQHIKLLRARLIARCDGSIMGGRL
jgi:hypothetical protein